MHVKSSIVDYDHEQLLELASGTLGNMRGTETKPAVPLETLLTQDTGLVLSDIAMVIVLRTSGQPVILRGKHLPYIEKIVLTSGDMKLGDTVHPWALAPEDEATYDDLIATLGSRRKHNVYRIDIHPKMN